MANEVKLEVYTFRIKEKHKDNYFNLGSFVEDKDFFTFFTEFINSFTKDISVNEEVKKSVQFQSENMTIDPGHRIISGIVESGIYGAESKIVHRKTKKTQYKKGYDDLDIKPFYFLFYAPADKNIGLLIMQRMGGDGINGIMKSHVHKLFSESYDKLLVQFAPYLSPELPKQLLAKNSISEITLRRFNLPEDISDKLGLGNHKNVRSIEIKIIAAKNKTFPIGTRLKSFLKNPNAAFFDMPEMSKIGFDQTSKPSVKIGTGKDARTVDLSDNLQMRPYYDIDEQVEKKQGNPVFSSIDSIAKGLLKTILKEMGYETN